MEKTDSKKQQIRTATIPLKDAYNKGRYTKRAKKSIFIIKKYISRHAKTDVKNIKIGVQLNEFIWKHGIKNPPRSIKIQIYKKDKFTLVNLTNIDIVGKEKERDEKQKLKKEEQKKESQKEEEKIKAGEELKKEEAVPEKKEETAEKSSKEKTPNSAAKAEVKKSPQKEETAEKPAVETKESPKKKETDTK
ncbi:MAG: hypothetical protein DRN66_03335 [Candidatus Nanohalarchaeota archaeon]|nr:MAG: hypothetical protein DRN66_03335 [Candidatus Nanohaloarchaeota archaeon]